jgi:uncharacterized protein with GYD domain
MPKFLFTYHYSSASWARMLTVTDDRAATVASLVEYLGGTLECIYWSVEDAAAYVICELPDSLSAAAAITAVTRTGGFKDVRVDHLLDQEQLRSVVDLAKDTSSVFHTPGAAAVE